MRPKQVLGQLLAVAVLSVLGCVPAAERREPPTPGVLTVRQRVPGQRGRDARTPLRAGRLRAASRRARSPHARRTRPQPRGIRQAPRGRRLRHTHARFLRPPRLRPGRPHRPSPHPQGRIQLGVVGFSFGGRAAVILAATRPERIRAAVSYYAVTSHPHLAGALSGRAARAEPLPARVEAIRAPPLIHHGEADANVPVEQARLLHRAMLAAGKSSSLYTYRAPITCSIFRSVPTSASTPPRPGVVPRIAAPRGPRGSRYRRSCTRPPGR